MVEGEGGEQGEDGGGGEISIISATISGGS